MVSLREIPLSEDKLTDWIFKQFIFFLRRETLHIKRRKRLLDEHRRVIRGLMNSESDPNLVITINCARSQHENRDEEVETLIHELAHIVFWKTREGFIRQIEKILIDNFTQAQKDLLKSFIPRYEVKQ